MKIKRVRKVKVPATTNNIQVGIINQLNVDGHRAMRFNAGGVFDQAGGFFRKQKRETKGVADVLACLKPSGKFAAFEIKNAGDTIRPAQHAFRAEVLNAGGEHIYVYSFEDFTDWYNKSIHKPSVPNEPITKLPSRKRKESL